MSGRRHGRAKIPKDVVNKMAIVNAQIGNSNPDGSMKMSKAVADKLTIVNAQIAHQNPDAVQIMYGELQSALQEVEERKKIEETLKQQVKVLEPQSFSLGAAMDLQNNDLEPRNGRRANMWVLKNLHGEFSEALEDLEIANPGVDTSKLAELALKLGGLAQKIERHDEYSVTNARTQLNRQKQRTAFHRNRAIVLRAERNVAQTTLAMVQNIGLRTLGDVKGPNKFKSMEAKLSLDSMVAKALMEMQAVSAELETPVEPIAPENEDDAADAAEDDNTKPKGNFPDLDKIVDSFRRIVEHAIATGKTLQMIPAQPAALERPSQTVSAITKDADKKTWDAEVRAKTAELALAAKTLEADLCNQNLGQLQANGAQANGIGTTGLDESIISAYLEMAKSNISSGQVLIDRIECLENCVLGCNENNSRKRKRGCDGYHAGVSPAALQGLIQRLTDKIPPQADLIAKIVDLLTILRARLEQRARDVSPHKRLSSGSEDSFMTNCSQYSVMSNTGDLDTQALLQLNFASAQNGEVLITRITELESELHHLKSHPGGVPGGNATCPRELEEAKKQIQDLTSRVINLDFELHTLQSHSTEAPSGNDDCPDRLRRAGELNQALIKRTGTLESELHTLKKHPHGETGGDKDCPKELEKAKKQLEELAAKLKASEGEIEELEGDKAWYEDYIDQHNQERDDLESDKIEELKDQIAALKSQVEQLKKEKREVEKRRDICYNYNLDILEPTLAARNAEIRGLKDDVYDLDGLQASLDACLERNTKAQAELNAYHLADAINLDIENHGSRELEEYAALLVRIRYLKNKWRNCEEARGDKAVESDEDSGYEEEENAEWMETIALLSRADLLDILRKVVDFEAIYLKQMDVMEELTKNNEYRQRELMRTLGDANLKISQAETNSQKLNEIIGDLRDEIKNLKNSLKNCREFRDSVIKLRIDKPEEPRDLEGLDVTALIKEIIDLQRKLKALGIRYEEAVKNDQTFDTDSELSEDLEFQNPRQQILDLRAALADVRAALKRCNEAHEEVVDNTEDAASIAILKEGVQKLRDEHDETRDKLRLCEDEVDRLIKELRKQLDSRERDLKNEKEQAEKQAEREARYEHAITVLVDAAKEDKDFYEAKIQRLNDLEKNASTSQGANSGNVEQLQEQLAQIEAELQAEKKKAAASNKAAAKSFSSLEKEKQKTAKCERKLTDLRAQHPTTGLGNGKSSRKRSASKAHDSEPDEECLEDCVAELAKLKHEIAGFKVERARLKAQLREQGDETDNYEEGARWSKRHKQQLSEEWVNGEDDEGEEQDDLQPLEDNNFDPHNGTCNDEIEALNNQITAQKQELAALEQQAELDKLQIDALKHGNTDKSKAHQKFAALIEKLRTELEALQARLAECSSETWQERRARMRRLAAANRGPQGPTIHRLDPALAQMEEWNRSGWWRTERSRPEKRRRTQ